MHLFPPVKTISKLPGLMKRPEQLLVPTIEAYPQLINVAFLFPIEWVNTSTMMSFMTDRSLPKEGYHLSIRLDRISLSYSDYQGLLHGLFTLEQILLQSEEGIELWDIYDEPDLPVRGVLIDISRNKIPTLSTLQSMVSNLARLKLNHLELYVEGRSLEFPSQAHHYHDAPLTLDTYQKLDDYCHLYGIDLVGNMNTFGHMSDWLSLKDYHSLSECPNGFKQWGVTWPASTLNPLNDGSFRLVKQLLDDFIPMTTSPYFNINGDEPFELGRGRSKKVCQATSVESVYLDFISKVLTTVQSYDKIPMMWADVIIHHPELATKLPKGTHVIDWGYDRMYDFEPHAKALHDLNVPFLLAPGTSTWNSFTGRYQDMKKTTNNACLAAKKYQGKGVITTDWGDNGHLQYLPWSWIGFAYSAMLCWTDSISDEAMSWALNTLIYEDPQQRLSQAMMALSAYNDRETTYTYNGTMLFQVLQFVDTENRYPLWLAKRFHRRVLLKNPLSDSSIQSLQAMIQDFETCVNELTLELLLKEELRQTVRWLKLSLMVRINLQKPQSIHKEALLSLIDETIYHHERLWVQRNLPSHLDESLKRIKTLRKFIQS